MQLKPFFAPFDQNVRQARAERDIEGLKRRGQLPDNGGGIDFNKNNTLDVNGNNADYLMIETTGTSTLASNFAYALTYAGVQIINTSTGSGIELVNDGDDGVGILQTGDGTKTNPLSGNTVGIAIENAGNGDFVLNNNAGSGARFHIDDRSDDLILSNAGNGITLEVAGGGNITLTGIPTSNPGGSGRIWKNGTVLNIT